MNSLGKSLLLPYTLMSLVLDFSQMILAVRNHLNRAILIILQNPEQCLIFQCFEKFTLGMSLFLPYTLVSLGLDFTQMVLDVRKNLKPTQFYMLNNLCFNNFSKNSLSGEVLALALHLGVFGAGLHPDGPGCPEKP